MRFQNALSVFIYLLVAEVFFYFVTSVYPGGFFGRYGELLFAAAFSITMMGFLAASIRHGNRITRAYYFLVWLVSLVFAYVLVFHNDMISGIMRLYFGLAVLVALLLSIIEQRRYSQRVKVKIVHDGSADIERQKRIRDRVGYQKALDEQGRQIDDLKEYSERMREMKNRYQKESEEKLLTLAKTREQLDRLAMETELVSKRLNDGLGYKMELERKEAMIAEKNSRIMAAKQRLSELEQKNEALKKVLGKAINMAEGKEELTQKYRNTLKGIADTKRVISELETDNVKLKKIIGKTMIEARRQTELKQKYSKTLRNIQKDKEELEALLVVSPDGTSVHRPNCIVVRNVAKEDRKLIPSWKEAKKGRYKGCKLCNPDKSNESVMKGNVKYRFVGSSGSDKFHKPSCTVLANSISSKDKQYFKSYKQAVKKGYTPCRVCSPQQ
jgi:methylphosphotriester-DNA--protein-cysteine methyltransferase